MIRKTLLIGLTTTLLALFLSTAFIPVALCQDWTPTNKQASHPKDMTKAERQQWGDKLQKLQDALEKINDPNKYKKGEYECNKFSDYTATELSKLCFTVKRAKNTQFKAPDGTTSEHHWVFVVVKVNNKEVWIPVECTPPEGQRQKEPGQLAEWPNIPLDEQYRDPATDTLKPEDKFDERYFGSMQVKDVAKPTQCNDPLAALSKTAPMAILAQDALTNEPLSLPLSIYRSDGSLAQSLTTGTDGKANIILPTGKYYIKAKINLFWFNIPTYTSPEIALDRPYNLNIMVSTVIPVKYVPLAIYTLCGIIAALIVYRLVRLFI